MSAPSHYLAFDLGASSGRALLGTLKDGKMRMDEVHRFDTPVVERDDHLYWDIELLWEELCAGLAKALEVAPDIKSLSVDSWAVDYVRLNRDGKPLGNPFAYRDERLDGVMESAWSTVPPSEIYGITGIQFLPFNSLYQVIADYRDEVLAREEVACRLCIADYFNFRFGGASLDEAAIDESMASTTQLMDVRSRAWSTDLMRRFDIDDGTWPRIVKPGTVLGTVAAHPGIRIVACCSHDTGSAVAATPASGEAHWAFVSCGTWSLFGVELDEPLVSEDSLAYGFTNEAGIDGTVRFLKNLTGFWILQECQRAWEEQDGSAIDIGALMDDAEAAEFGGKHIDMQDGRFLPRGHMPTTLAGYCNEKQIDLPATRAGVVRLIVESMADSYRRTLREVEHLTGKTIETIHLFGGGSRSSLLARLTADVCGVRVVTGPVEATALGNLLVQARALGDFDAGDNIRSVSVRSSDLQEYLPSQTG